MNRNGSAVGFGSTETLLDSACRLYITTLSGKASTGKFSDTRERRLSDSPDVSVNILFLVGLCFHNGCRGLALFDKL